MGLTELIRLPSPKTMNTPIEWKSTETGTLAAGWAMELGKFRVSFLPNPCIEFVRVERSR